MDISVYREILAILPRGRTLFHYERDRYAVQLIRYLLRAGWSMRALKESRYARLLGKQPVRDLMSAFGTLDIGQDEIELAPMERPVPWRLTLSRWGNDRDHRYVQICRKGFNLVLQLNMPTEHNELLANLTSPHLANILIRRGHPNNQDEITLAWARIDVDFDNGEALIEEIQSDWIRDVPDVIKYPRYYRNRIRGRFGHDAVSSLPPLGLAKRMKHYSDKHLPRYADRWEETMLAAALFFIVEELGLKCVYMHDFNTGNSLKNIDPDYAPPKSLYTKLPKRFCFEQDGFGPNFLVGETGALTRRKHRRKKLRGPVRFWKLDLTELKSRDAGRTIENGREQEATLPDGGRSGIRPASEVAL